MREVIVVVIECRIHLWEEGVVVDYVLLQGLRCIAPHPSSVRTHQKDEGEVRRW